jgi:hypothetical protein
VIVLARLVTVGGTIVTVGCGGLVTVVEVGGVVVVDAVVA